MLLQQLFSQASDWIDKFDKDYNNFKTFTMTKNKLFLFLLTCSICIVLKVQGGEFRKIGACLFYSFVLCAEVINICKF